MCISAELLISAWDTIFRDILFYYQLFSEHVDG